MKIIRRHGFRKKRPSFCKEGRFLRGFPIIKRLPTDRKGFISKHSITTAASL